MKTTLAREKERTEMQTAIVVKGRLINPTIIELEEPVTTAMGNVEVVLRLVTPEPAEAEAPKPRGRYTAYGRTPASTSALKR
jgi:hypothetical protein